MKAFDSKTAFLTSVLKTVMDPPGGLNELPPSVCMCDLCKNGKTMAHGGSAYTHNGAEENNSNLFAVKTNRSRHD